MIDCDLRTWLIEVNTNPYLGTQARRIMYLAMILPLHYLKLQNPWHGRLLARMTEDLVSLAIDQHFPPPVGADGPLAPHPLPDDVYTKAFVHQLRWLPVAAARKASIDAAAETDSAGVTGVIVSVAETPTASEASATPMPSPSLGLQRTRAVPSAVAFPEAEARSLDVSVQHVIAPSALTAPGTQQLMVTGATLSPRLHVDGFVPGKSGRVPHSVPASSKGHGKEPLPPAPAVAEEIDEPARPPYRDPRTNGFELLYTEDLTVPVSSIPHQALVMPAALNAAIVDAAASEVPSPGLLAQLKRSSDDTAAQSEFLPFTRRYVRRRSASWLYPLGSPSPLTDDEAAPWRAAAAAQAEREKERESHHLPTVSPSRPRAKRDARREGSPPAPQRDRSRSHREALLPNPAELATQDDTKSTDVTEPVSLPGARSDNITAAEAREKDASEL
jgi:hypothetical protein